METEDQLKEHKWLQRLVGEWAYEFEASSGPGKPNVTMKGTEVVRPLGTLWVLIEARGEPSSAGPDTSQIVIGFDAQQKKFVGSFISSSMSRMWIYDGGSFDAAKGRLALSSIGPSMADEGKTAMYEDIHELTSDGERSFTSRVQRPDDTWVEFMRGTYRRVR